MKPTMLAVTFGAVASIFAAQYLEFDTLETFGLVIAGMLTALFLYKRFSKGSSGV